MSKIIKPGSIIKDYTITELLHKGGLALSYAAKHTSGQKIFFKQYKTPAVTTPWYSSYVAYQVEFKKRIEESKVSNFTCGLIDSFEAKYGANNFFQAFEFIEGGHDMEKVLDKIRNNPKSISWDQRLIFAKVMMNGVGALHDANIVHGDLKPANLQMLPDSSIKAGYQLKVIDMDFSIMTDKEIPWLGYLGYVGTPGYLSPEHITGQVPQPASDVFTCGLILYELIGEGRNPYAGLEDYKETIQSYKAAPPVLSGEVPKPGSNEQIAEYIYRCLDPNPEKRPTAKDMNLVLNGAI